MVIRLFLRPYRYVLKQIKRFSALITACLCLTLAIFIIWDFYSVRIPIFGFHDIYSDETKTYQSTAPYLDYKTSDLKSFIVDLIHENYWFLSAKNIDDYFISKRLAIPQEKKGHRAIALSFDDAYESVHTQVLPILEAIEDEYGIKIPIILFLNSERMAGESQKHPQQAHYLTCEQVQSGWITGFYDLQSAGAAHRILTKDDPKTISEDLTKDQRWLHNCIKDVSNSAVIKNEDVGQHFAYPYNRVNLNVRQIVSRYYQTAYRYDRRLQRMGWTTRRYSISRLGVDRKTPLWWMRWQAHRASYLTIL
jgi:peptidoglycan/xylan/chitin deacetylase (PgdA/CDA1 family)